MLNRRLQDLYIVSVNRSANSGIAETSSLLFMLILVSLSSILLPMKLVDSSSAKVFIKSLMKRYGVPIVHTKDLDGYFLMVSGKYSSILKIVFANLIICSILSDFICGTCLILTSLPLICYIVGSISKLYLLFPLNQFFDKSMVLLLHWKQENISLDTEKIINLSFRSSWDLHIIDGQFSIIFLFVMI